MKKLLVILTALLLVGMVSGANAMEKGASVFAIELGNGSAEVSDTPVIAGLTPDYVGVSQVPELNVQGEFWYGLSEDYALTLSGGMGFSSYKQTPNDGTLDSEDTFSHSSYRVRVGGDRVGKVGDRLTVFVGPGLEFFGSKGKIKSEGGGLSLSADTQNTTRFAVSGRIGGMMKLNDVVSIVGRVGHNLGMVSSKADVGNAEVKSWTSGLDAAWGIAFAFGGK